MSIRHGSSTTPYFSDEHAADVLFSTDGTNDRRILFGHTSNALPILSLSADSAVVSGDFKSTNVVVTNLVSSTGVMIAMNGTTEQSPYASAALFASSRAGAGFRGSNLGGGSNAVYEATHFSSNLSLLAVTSASNVNLTGALSASNVDLTGTLTTTDIDLSGAFMLNGVPLLQSTRSQQMTQYITGGTVGTESVPIAGGNLVLDTTVALSAIVELASSSEPLSITLDPSSASFATTQVGKSGNIILVERSTTGRTLTLDPRIHFATGYNKTASTGFDVNSLDSTTLSSGVTTSPAPALGGFAVDTIDYYIPKPGFAIGKYFRQFKCMPPTFDDAALAGVTHVGITSAAAYVLNIPSFLVSAYAQFYGPLLFSLPPSGTPANVSIDGISGILTFDTNTAFAGSLVVSIQGVAGTTTRTLTFDVKP
jgi:hypothetical protein